MLMICEIGEKVLHLSQKQLKHFNFNIRLYKAVIICENDCRFLFLCNRKFLKFVKSNREGIILILKCL